VVAPTLMREAGEPSALRNVSRSSYSGVVPAPTGGRHTRITDNFAQRTTAQSQCEKASRMRMGKRENSAVKGTIEAVTPRRIPRPWSSW
jgi:hypothetical protein